MDGLGCFTLHHPQTTLAARKKEIDLEPLLIAKVVKFLPPALVDLALQDLRGHVSFEQRAKERGPVQFGLRRDPQEVARQPRVPQVHLGGLDEALAAVLEVWRNQDDLARDLQNVKPIAYRWNGDTKRSSQIGLVQDLPMPAGHQCQEAPEGGQVANIRDGADVPLQIRLDVRTEPQSAPGGTRHHLRVAAVKEADSIRLSQTERQQRQD